MGLTRKFTVHVNYAHNYAHVTFQLTKEQGEGSYILLLPSSYTKNKKWSAAPRLSHAGKVRRNGAEVQRRRLAAVKSLASGAKPTASFHFKRFIDLPLSSSATQEDTWKEICDGAVMWETRGDLLRFLTSTSARQQPHTVGHFNFIPPPFSCPRCCCIQDSTLKHSSAFIHAPIQKRQRVAGSNITKC